jgi:hypothetical protein
MCDNKPEGSSMESFTVAEKDTENAGKTYSPKNYV